MTRYLLAFALAGGLFSWRSAVSSPSRLSPIADYHQHLFSPAVMELVGTESGLRGISASDLVPLLDSAGIQHALLLSTAYMFGNPFRTVQDEYAKVKAANDWTADQAAKYPGRLQAFCGF